jgi:hypothetical protein
MRPVGFARHPRPHAACGHEGGWMTREPESDLVRAAYKAAARLFGETSADEATERAKSSPENAEEDTFLAHAKSVGPESWTSVPLSDVL